MAEAKNQSKIDAAAEKAYEDAAAKTAPKTADAAKVAQAVEAGEHKADASVAAIAEAVEAPKAAAPKAAAPKKTSVKKPAVKKTVTKKAPAKKPVAATQKKTAIKAAAKTQTTSPISKLKDTIMATAQNTDFAAQAKDMAADVQERLKTAYAKTGEFAGDFGEFSKANVEAMVESGKIFFTGAQELVRENVETGKSVVETITEDAKKVVAVKSPTELMQLQGELARRNFDAVVAYGSKRTEAWVKLYNDAFAPISNRVSVATEKLTKAA